jgi:hypothetical protein
MSEEEHKKQEDEVQEPDHRPEPRNEPPKKPPERELGEFERSDHGEEDLT